MTQKEALALVEGILMREIARLQKKGFPLPQGTAIRVLWRSDEDDRYGEYLGAGDHTLVDIPDGPSEIVLYAAPLIQDFGVSRRLAKEIRITLLHELAHSLGADEDWVERQGLG